MHFAASRLCRRDPAQPACAERESAAVLRDRWRCSSALHGTARDSPTVAPDSAPRWDFFSDGASDDQSLGPRPSLVTIRVR